MAEKRRNHFHFHPLKETKTMTLAISHEDAIAESFLGVQNLLHSTCHDFRRKYGGNHEDLFSHAQEIFMVAHEDFDPSKGMKFSTYVRQCIWWRLMDGLAKEQHRVKQIPREDFGQTEYKLSITRQRPFDLDDFCEISGMGKDAKTIVKLAATRTEVPGEIRKGKAALKEILTDELKWGRLRIRKAFQEITAALKAAQ